MLGTNHGLYNTDVLLQLIGPHASYTPVQQLTHFIQTQKKKICPIPQPPKKRISMPTCSFQPGQLVELDACIDGTRCFIYAYFQTLKEDSTAVVLDRNNDLKEVPLSAVYLPRGPIRERVQKGHNIEIFTCINGTFGWYRAYYVGPDETKKDKVLAIPQKVQDGRARLFSISNANVRQVTDTKDENPAQMKRLKH